MKDLQEYIYSHIPVVEKNNFSINQSGSRIEVRGRYDDHINHRNSVFGGSLSTAMTIAAWAYVLEITEELNLENASAVIYRQEVKYLTPVLKDFVAVNHTITPAEIEDASERLIHYGKAKVRVSSDITHIGEDEVLATFLGDFVVINS